MAQQHEEMSSFLVEEIQVLNTTIDHNENKMQTKIKDNEKELLELKTLVSELIEANNKLSEESKVLKAIVDENNEKMSQMETKVQDNNNEIVVIKKTTIVELETLARENKETIEQMSKEISALKTFTNFPV